MTRAYSFGSVANAKQTTTKIDSSDGRWAGQWAWQVGGRGFGA